MSATQTRRAAVGILGLQAGEDVNIAIAKITSKCQTTIPQEIRAALHLTPGDTIVWELIEGGMARVRRLDPLDVDYLRALEGTLGEWHSSADEEAYRDL